MTALPTSNLTLSEIAAKLGVTKDLRICCSTPNVVANGLKSPWCPGTTEAEKLANLRADKKQSYFKGYDPVSITTPDSFTYLDGKTFSIVTPVTSIEISHNGLYIFLIFAGPTVYEIRKYTLATPFDITTIGTTYQSFDFTYLGGGVSGGNSGSGLWLNPDGTIICFVRSSSVQILYLGTAYDLSSDLVMYGIDINSYAPSYESFPYNVAFDPSGYYMTVTGEDLFGDPMIFLLNVPYGPNPTFPAARGRNAVSYLQVRGLQWDYLGNNYYTLNVFNTCTLMKYQTLPYPYRPESTYPLNPVVSSWDLSSTLLVDEYAMDFCFSDDLRYMYILYWKPSSSVRILQFTIS